MRIAIVFFSLVLLVLFIWLLLRYFERSNLYFPTKRIEATPEDFGLNYEEIFFETSDGLRLNGWFLPFQHSKATLLFCHGNAGNISHRLEIIQIFHNLGLNVFIFDYRGYGKSKGLPSEKGTYLDAEAAYDYLISRTDIDKDKVIIYGKSIGANIAIELASRVKPCALIADSAFTSTLDMGKEIYPFLPIKLIVTMPYDALSKIGKIDIPKLIIHSRDDEIVPFHHGRKLFSAARQPKEFYSMRGGHNEAILIYKDEFQSHIGTFVKKYVEVR